VRGLNDRARRSGVRSVVSTTSASIVCLQETKLSTVTHAIVMEALGANFDAFICSYNKKHAWLVSALRTFLHTLLFSHREKISHTSNLKPTLQL
jgi:exonuclease III